MDSPATIAHARRLRRESTRSERILWKSLRRPPFDAYKFRRQHPIGRFFVDFVSLSARLIVELDGGQHAVQVRRDERRTQKLARLRFRVVRFWNNDVESNLEGVLAAIEAQVHVS